MARLMERPASTVSWRMSGRRSSTSTWKPRRARNRAISEPTRPAPARVTICVRSISCMALEDPHEAVQIEEAAVQRRGGSADDVRLAEVAEDSRLAQPGEQPLGLLAEAKRELRAPG